MRLSPKLRDHTSTWNHRYLSCLLKLEAHNDTIQTYPESHVLFIIIQMEAVGVNGFENRSQRPRHEGRIAGGNRVRSSPEIRRTAPSSLEEKRQFQCHRQQLIPPLYSNSIIAMNENRVLKSVSGTAVRRYSCDLEVRVVSRNVPNNGQD